jgi:hypothetical protein
LDNSAPVLVIGFNRPNSLEKVFNSLASSKPSRVLVAIDGPRKNIESDLPKVLKAQNTVSNINWNCRIETRFRTQNLGIRKGIPDAVSWAIEKYGRVIVIEDDLIPGPSFIDFMQNSLNRFEKNLRIGHISGYNLVPKKFITNPENLYRKSKFPESFGWGTWDRAWKFYTDEIEIESIDRQSFTKFEKYSWTKYFQMASADQISTWAFRWVAALWKNDLLCISPNRNISTYVGQINGTHTKRRPRYSEMKVEEINSLSIGEDTPLDKIADEWISKTIFKSSLIGNVDLRISQLALSAIHKLGRA